MTEKYRSVIVRTPRVVAFAFMGFLMLFSFDVFSPGVSPGEAIVGFLIHNIPVYILAAIVAVAWRREWLGAIIFAAAGLGYAVLVIADKGFPPYIFSWLASISGPAFVISAAYWVAWRLRTKS